MFDINAILALLPHRYPFVLVDRIIDITVEQFESFEENISYENKQDYHTKYELNLKSPRIKKLLSRVTSAYKKINHTNKIGYK